MTQPVTSNESDAELEKELAEIMGTAWNDSADADKSKNQSFNSVELPDLAELDLHGKIFYKLLFLML